jgi:hypothetical protein
MNLLLSVLLYFVAGFATDFLVTKYYLCLSRRQRVGASALAVVIDFWQYIIAMMLILDKNIPGAVGFAIGTGVGTWVAVGKKHNDTV